MREKIYIFDTTLRDGEQSPGASLNVYEKVEISRQLERLNIDIIEAGFPVSSQTQFEAVQRIADEVNLIVTGLARAVEKDIKVAYSALREAKRFRIHTFIGTSDIHLIGKFGHDRYGKSLNQKRKTILKMACDSVAYARTFTDDVEFSPEDAGRTDMDYLKEITEAVIDAGATTVNIPDTTGFTMPREFGEKIAELKKHVGNIDRVIISVHCHNDLGLAVANSLAAIENGARQVECTINGIGERAGNASLEEIVMALEVRKSFWNYDTYIRTEEINNTSKMVSGFTGMVIQPNKAIVGENAFAHESGIHQDGVIKLKQTYEIMTPESVGVADTKIVLGRHSGRHGLEVRLKELGYHLSREEMEHMYEKFLELADKKKEIFDDDLRVLMGDEIGHQNEYYELDYFHVNLGTNIVPTATVRIKVEDKVCQESATGDGPVNASFNAIDRALGTKSHLESYQVRSITVGRKAQGEVLVRIRKGDHSFIGKGISTDIIEASAKAYLKALDEQRVFSKNKPIVEPVVVP